MSNALDQIAQLEARVSRAVVGQQQVVESLILGQLCNGNLLLEGYPGTEVFREIDGERRLDLQPGPIFNNLVLADEPNRVLVYGLETDVVEILQRVYYFAKRLAKAVVAATATGEQKRGFDRRHVSFRDRSQFEAVLNRQSNYGSPPQ